MRAVVLCGLCGAALCWNVSASSGAANIGAVRGTVHSAVVAGVVAETIREAQKLIGIEFTAEEREGIGEECGRGD